MPDEAADLKVDLNIDWRLGRHHTREGQKLFYDVTRDEHKTFPIR